MLLLLPFTASAAVATTSEDTTIVLPSNGDSYTLKNGASFNKIDVTSATITFTLDPKDQIILISTAKHKFTNDRGVETTCNTDDSRIVQSVATTGVQVVVAITPSGSCTTSTTVATGGGGGGTTGSPSVPSSPTSASPAPTPVPISTATPTPSPVLQPSVSTVPQPIISPSAAVSVSPVIITRAIRPGSQGRDIVMLQTFLASDRSLYPAGIVNGVFGPLTRMAVGRFQEKYGIARRGQPGYQVLGPKTRAKLQELTSISPPSVFLPPPPSIMSPPSSSPSSGLGISDRQVQINAFQAQIKALQDMIDKLKKR